MTTITVREVDERVFRQFKARAVVQGMTLGKALTLVMGSWAAKKSGNKNFFGMMPVDLGDPHLSERIDEVLYS